MVPARCASVSNKTDRPRPEDDLEAAQSKSKSVDERLEDPQAAGSSPVPVPGPAGYVPQAGLGAPGTLPEQGEGEAALERERKAVREQKQTS
jgi:hypothetical protein